MNVDLGDLRIFLIVAKKNTYAAGGKEITPGRPGFRELEYRKGDFYYRDSYAGYYRAPGMEVVYFKDKPVWTMVYIGGMQEKYYDKAEPTYTCLKKALMKVPVEHPYRGPENFEEGDFKYEFKVSGDMTDFSGVEKIFLKGEEVFRQEIIGGLIIDK